MANRYGICTPDTELKPDEIIIKSVHVYPLFVPLLIVCN